MSCVWKSQNNNNQESASAGNLQSKAYSSKAVHVGIYDLESLFFAQNTQNDFSLLTGASLSLLLQQVLSFFFFAWCTVKDVLHRSLGLSIYVRGRRGGHCHWMQYTYARSARLSFWQNEAFCTIIGLKMPKGSALWGLNGHACSDNTWVARPMLITLNYLEEKCWLLINELLQSQIPSLTTTTKNKSINFLCLFLSHDSLANYVAHCI